MTKRLFWAGRKRACSRWEFSLAFHRCEAIRSSYSLIDPTRSSSASSPGTASPECALSNPQSHFPIFQSQLQVARLKFTILNGLRYIVSLLSFFFSGSPWRWNTIPLLLLFSKGVRDASDILGLLLLTTCEPFRVVIKLSIIIFNAIIFVLCQLNQILFLLNLVFDKVLK